MKAKRNEPLEESIAHWVENRTALEDNVDKPIEHVGRHVYRVGDVEIAIGPPHCALCEKHRGGEADVFCDQCEVCARTGERGCRGTPWIEIQKLLNTGVNSAELRGKTSSMILLLKSCRAQPEPVWIGADCAYQFDGRCDKSVDNNVCPKGSISCVTHATTLPPDEQTRVQDRRIVRAVRARLFPDAISIGALDNVRNAACSLDKCGCDDTATMLRSLASIMSPAQPEAKAEKVGVAPVVLGEHNTAALTDQQRARLEAVERFLGQTGRPGVEGAAVILEENNRCNSPGFLRKINKTR